jgi:hypothetical protein
VAARTQNLISLREKPWPAGPAGRAKLVLSRRCPLVEACRLPGKQVGGLGISEQLTGNLYSGVHSNRDHQNSPTREAYEIDNQQITGIVASNRRRCKKPDDTESHCTLFAKPSAYLLWRAPFRLPSSLSIGARCTAGGTDLNSSTVATAGTK